MALNTLTASVEQLLADVDAAAEDRSAHPGLVLRIRGLRNAALWEQDAPGKTSRLLDFAANCLDFVTDAPGATKYLRLALDGLRDRAKRLPTYLAGHTNLHARQHS